VESALQAVKGAADLAGIPCKYACLQGTCGKCDAFLKDTETDELRPVRVCVTQFPSGESASLMPYEVLPTASAEAQEYYARMRAKYGSADTDTD